MRERIVFPSDLAAYCVLSLLAVVVALLSDIFYPDPEATKRVMLYTVMILGSASLGYIVSVQGDGYGG